VTRDRGSHFDKAFASHWDDFCGGIYALAREDGIEPSGNKHDAGEHAKDRPGDTLV
jgi:hypothetical protein